MSDFSSVILPEPLAYFLTWPTYGTWLPGDERGWVQYRRGFQSPDTVKELEASARMTEDACRLNEQERHIVEATINAHCCMRDWTLHAVNCRSNHLHIVLTASEHPDDVRDQLKAWCTRRLKENKRAQIPLDLQETVTVGSRWWAERGSKRYINDEVSLEAAILYICDAQDMVRH